MRATLRSFYSGGPLTEPRRSSAETATSLGTHFVGSLGSIFAFSSFSHMDFVPMRRRQTNVAEDPGA